MDRAPASGRRVGYVVARLVIVLAAVGSGISMVANLVAVARLSSARPERQSA